jgi:YgiT-type zinc finger domain-containing protein
MTQLKCPKCRKADLVRSTIENFDTKLGGVPFTIQNANVWRCGECGHVVATAKDLKQWREAQKAFIQARGFVPSAATVRTLRRTLGLSVADLAALMAVTRQTVHAWERDGLNALQLGPAAIILRLLAKEIENNGARGLLKALIDEAQARGQSLRDRSNPVSGHSETQLQVAPPGSNETITKVDLPGGNHCSGSINRGPTTLKRCQGDRAERSEVDVLIQQRGSVWGKPPAGKAA